MRPPRWHRDEIILALDLYRTIEPKEMDNKNPKVIELSELLNKLPIHKERMVNQKFRNPNVTHSPVFAPIVGLYCPLTVCIKFSVVSAAT